MACCGLCRPKVKSTNKNNKNITTKKINTIDMWIENLEAPYESIVLPSKPPDKPKTMTNQEEIIEIKMNRSDQVTLNRKAKGGKQNFQYLSSELSFNEETLSSISESNTTNNSRSLFSFQQH